MNSPKLHLLVEPLEDQTCECMHTTASASLPHAEYDPTLSISKLACGRTAKMPYLSCDKENDPQGCNREVEHGRTSGGVGLEEGRKHQGLHSHELDEDVQ